MSEEPIEPHGYDPTGEDELNEEPASAEHNDLPDPDGKGPIAQDDPELLKRKKQALLHLEQRNEELD